MSTDDYDDDDEDDDELLLEDEDYLLFLFFIGLLFFCYRVLTGLDLFSLFFYYLPDYD